MSDNVIPLGNVTYLDISPDIILEQCKGQCSGGVVILGFDNDEDFYFASSLADGGSVIWLLELAKKKLLEIEI